MDQSQPDTNMRAHSNNSEIPMELIVIALVGTLVLMAAELRDFLRRERSAR
jgi:hypothetical protein